MEFPDWVEGPTPCKTRSYSVHLENPGHNVRGPLKLVSSFPNRPVRLTRNKENGRLHIRWADVPATDTRFEDVEE